MDSITAANPDVGLYATLIKLLRSGRENPSRNGPVIRFRGRFAIEWVNPVQRVSFDPLRDANPIFHLFESMWMLGGRNDVESVAWFAPHIASFSDNGETINGAYGQRWRSHFGNDQLLDYVIPSLRKDATDRRVVMQMWDGDYDIVSAKRKSKDVCCNLSVVFDATSGELDMTVTNRSNDIVLGACGANVVHFSMLHEFVAHAVGLPVGSYTQFSTNSHAYTEMAASAKCVEQAHRMIKRQDMGAEVDWLDMTYPASVFPLNRGYESETGREKFVNDFLSDIDMLMNTYKDLTDAEFKTPYFNFVIVPVVQSFNLYKKDELTRASALLGERMTMEPTDWILATKNWIDRRIVNRNKVIDDWNRDWRPDVSREDFEKTLGRVWASTTAADTSGTQSTYWSRDPHRTVATFSPGAGSWIRRHQTEEAKQPSKERAND